MKIKNTKHYTPEQVEVIHDIIREMERLVGEAKDAHVNKAGLSKELKFNTLKYIEDRMASYSYLVVNTLGFEVRDDDGMLYTSKLFNKVFYYRQTAEIEYNKEVTQ